MCGYVRRHIGPKSLVQFLDLMGLKPAQLTLLPNDEPVLEHFYPAWGGNVERKIKGLIIREEGQIKQIDATWWFHCEFRNGEFKTGYKETFNARNLDLDIWKNAIRENRGILVATAIGEAIEKPKKQQFFVQSEGPLLLGCVYKKFPNGAYSCAVITRDAHPRFTDFHEDAFPLMLPHDEKFLALWLSDEKEDHPAISALLDHPRIFNTLTVTPVKTYKDAKPMGESVNVTPDEWALVS